MPPKGYNEDDFQFVKELGSRIRARREEMGFVGPTDLARAMGDPTISGEYISGVERGQNGPRLRMLVQIAKGLKTTTSHLLGDSNGTVVDADADRAYKQGYNQCLLDTHEALQVLRTENL